MRWQKGWWGYFEELLWDFKSLVEGWTWKTGSWLGIFQISSEICKLIYQFKSKASVDKLLSNILEHVFDSKKTDLKHLQLVLSIWQGFAKCRIISREVSLDPRRSGPLRLRLKFIWENLQRPQLNTDDISRWNAIQAKYFSQMIKLVSSKHSQNNFTIKCLQSEESSEFPSSQRHTSIQYAP